MTDRIPDVTEARNIEPGLRLQLCFLHPSKCKFEHPRFCFGQLVSQKIQFELNPASTFHLRDLEEEKGKKDDSKAYVKTSSMVVPFHFLWDLVMAKRLFVKPLDAPGRWLEEKHRSLLRNKSCRKYLRGKNLHRFVIYSEQIKMRMNTIKDRGTEPQLPSNRPFTGFLIHCTLKTRRKAPHVRDF